MNIALPYGRSFVEADIPAGRIVKLMHSRLNTYSVQGSMEDVVQRAMNAPIGTPTLPELARGKKRVVIIASDHTRPVPSRLIIPPMLAQIRQTAPDADVTLLIATGCHRPSTEGELREKFGDAVYDSERIVIHNSGDQSNMACIGVLPSGGRLVINKLAAEADLLLAEGLIEQHFFAGFSGGRKSVLPGVASSEAVYHNHNAALIDDAHSRMGEMEHNRINQDMVYAAKQAGLAYIVNVVMNARRVPIAAFAGDVDLAHRAGCDFYRRLASEPPVHADIVITTNNGYPLDQNLYQAVKCMTTAEAVCPPGGVIIALAQCEDGVGGDAFYRMFQNSASPASLLAELRRRAPAQTAQDQWQAQIMARILTNHHVILLSDLPDEITKAFSLTPAHSMAEALALADGLVGRQDAGICVIPEGVSTMVAAI